MTKVSDNPEDRLIDDFIREDEIKSEKVMGWHEIKSEPTKTPNTSEANLTIPAVSKQSELLVFLEWYLQNRGRYSSSEPKYMVEEYLNQ